MAQQEGINKGDIIYFYVTNPYRAILYKCQVESIEVYQMDNSTKEHISNSSFYENKQQYMCLKLLNSYPEDFLTDEKLKKYGIHNLQKTIKMPENLSKKINQIENAYDFSIKGFAKKIFFPILIVASVSLIFSLIGLKNPYMNSSLPEQNTEKANLILATSASFPPYEYYEGEEIVGIDIEIAEAIAEKLNRELIIQNVNYEDVHKCVASKEADIGLASMTETEERLEYVDFTNSYITNKQIIVVKNNSDINSVDDLEYYGSIGVKYNTIADIYATIICGDNSIKRKR